MEIKMVSGYIDIEDIYFHNLIHRVLNSFPPDLYQRHLGPRNQKRYEDPYEGYRAIIHSWKYIKFQFLSCILLIWKWIFKKRAGQRILWWRSFERDPAPFDINTRQMCLSLYVVLVSPRDGANNFRKKTRLVLDVCTIWYWMACSRRYLRQLFFLPFSFSLYIPVNLWTEFGLTCFYNIRADLECTG